MWGIWLCGRLFLDIDIVHRRMGLRKCETGRLGLESLKMPKWLEYEKTFAYMS